VIRDKLDREYRPRESLWLELFEKPPELLLPPLPGRALNTGGEEARRKCRPSLVAVVVQYGLKFRTHMNLRVSLIEPR
jgi:hypothetical protein